MERPWQITNEEEWLELCREIVRCARGILDRSIELAEASLHLATLQSAARAAGDADFDTFRALNSATDRFPLGDVRELWNPEALARCDTERRAEQNRWRSRAEEACKNLIEKYECG
jgi:hypothetical protein